MLQRVMICVGLVAVTLFGGGVVRATGDTKTVLVTGANRGIGLEMVRQLIERGYTVIGTARKPGEATELNALEVRVEQLDVTDAESVAALANNLDGVAIDVLVNNAGVGGQDANHLAEVDFDQMAWTFDVNTLGPMRVTQALLGNLGEGEGKTVIHISSIMGSIEKNRGGYYDYRASKAALNMLNKSLSAELGNQGYTCVVIHPGWVKTRMGGVGAPVELTDSVAGMLSVIDGLSRKDNGRFLDYQGNSIPW